VAAAQSSHIEFVGGKVLEVGHMDLGLYRRVRLDCGPSGVMVTAEAGGCSDHVVETLQDCLSPHLSIHCSYSVSTSLFLL
jgi:hypothetical protein